MLQKVKSVEQGDYLLSSYFSAVRFLLINDLSGEYDELREALFDNLLTMRTTNPAYQKLWAIFQQAIKNHQQKKNTTFFDYCLQKLKSELKTIIHSNSNFEIDIFNRYT